MPEITARQVENITKKALLTVQPSKMWRTLEFTALFTGIAALAFSAFAVYQTNQSLEAAKEQTELAQDALVEARIATAYQILGSNSNDVGKSFAIELLLKAGQSIENFDFSCDVGDRRWTGNADDCLSQPSIRNVNLFGDAPTFDKGTEASRTTTTQGNRISDSYFQGVKFDNVTFKRIYIAYSSFDAANFEDTQFTEVDIDETTFNKVTGQLHFGVSVKNPFTSQADDEPHSWDVAYLSHASFNHTSARISFYGMSLSDTSFIGADMTKMSFYNTELKNVDISDALLCSGTPNKFNLALCPIVKGTNFNGAYYFESNPPIGLDFFQNRGLGMPKKCPPRPGIPDRNIPMDQQYTWNDYDKAAQAIGCPLYANFGPKI